MILHRSCKSMWIHTRNLKGTVKGSIKGSTKGSKKALKTQSVALVARILVKTRPFRTTGEKGSMKNTEACISSKNPLKTQPIRTTGEKGSMKTQSVALVARILWKHSLFALTGEKGSMKTQSVAFSSKNPCKNTTMSQASKRRWKNKAFSATSSLLRSFVRSKVHVHVQKGRQVSSKPLDDMWWCNKKQKFKNEVCIFDVCYYTVFST